MDYMDKSLQVMNRAAEFKSIRVRTRPDIHYVWKRGVDWGSASKALLQTLQVIFPNTTLVERMPSVPGKYCEYVVECGEKFPIYLYVQAS